MDHGLNKSVYNDYDMISHIINGGRNKKASELFKSLIQNTDFKNQFINTYMDLTNTYLSTEFEMKHFNRMVDEIDDYVEEFKNRWSIPLVWETEKAAAIETIEGRYEARLKQLKSNFELNNT